MCAFDVRERGNGEASDGGTKFKEISLPVLLLLLLPTQRTVNAFDVFSGEQTFAAP